MLGFSDPTIHAVQTVDSHVSDRDRGDEPNSNHWVELEFDQGPSARDRATLGIHTVAQRTAERLHAGIQAARWNDATNQQRSCVAAVALGWRWNGESEEWERDVRPGDPPNVDNPITVKSAVDAVKQDLGL